MLSRFRDFDEALGESQPTRASACRPASSRATSTRRSSAWDELEVGGVLIGDVPSFRVDHMPYGGVKDSGLGREGVRFAIEDMTELRLLVIRTP